MAYPQPLNIIGLEAFQIFLSLLRPVNGSREIWLKLGHNCFFVGDYNTSGDFEIAATKLTDPADSKSRVKTQKYRAAYEYISLWCDRQNGGAFFIPSQPQGLPLKANVNFSDDIAAELDSGSAIAQWNAIWEFVEISGLQPSYVVHSGGKSYHPHWKLTSHEEIDRVTRLKKLLAIALHSDPAVVNQHQPMRLPGFYRKEKGKYQSLSYHSEVRNTIDEFEAGLRRFFEYKGWIYPEVLSNDKWTLCRRVINWDKELSDRVYKELVDRG